MSSKSDWLQNNHEALYNQAGRTWSYLSVEDNRDRMGLAGLWAWLEVNFGTKYTAFAAAFEDWKDPSLRTPVKTVALRDTEEAFKVEYRHLYMGILRENPLVTDVDLVSMGLPQRSTNRPTPSPKPDTLPGYLLKLPAPGVVELHYFDSTGDGAKRAKPPGVHGVEIGWAVLDTPPVNWSALTNSAFDTASPYRFSFEGDQRGRRLYFALRWENTRGEKGPWSEIQDAIIP